MNKKIITTGLVLFLAFYTEAKPGETYTLTGTEIGVSEIIKADMAEFPELYEGESLSGYISKFKKRNEIGRRTLSPGDPLYFPETIASRKAKKTEIEEEKAKEREREKQKKRLARERINLFTENDETDWIPAAEFGELIKILDGKGYWQDQYWVTNIDGRYINNRPEYKLKYEPAPSDGRMYEFYWIYGKSIDAFEERKKLHKSNSLIMVHEQSFTLPNGEERYQAVWRIIRE